MNVKLITTGIIGVVVLIVLIALNPFVKVGAGERGVVMNWGAVQEEVLSEGIHWRTPIVQKVVKINVQTQKVENEAIAYSKDLQTATALIALNYHVTPDAANKLWQEIGKDYESRIIAPAIQEIMKQTSAKYEAQELIAKRTEVKVELKAGMTERLLPYHLVVDDVSIVNFDFSAAYERAIENKQVAEQDAQKADNDLKRIKIEAEQRIAQAQAEAEAIRIQAESISAQGGAEYVNLKAIEKWSGQLPTYMLGNSVPFINLNTQN